MTSINAPGPVREDGQRDRPPPNGSRKRSFDLCVGAVLLGMVSGVAAADDGAPYRIYVTNERSGDLSIIDGRTHEAIDRVALGKRPRGIEAGHDGAWLYIALSGSSPAGPGIDDGALPAPDKTADGIGVFSIADRKVNHIIRGVSDPEQVAIGRDGEWLYIASEDTGSAVIAHSGDGQILTSVSVGSEPEGVAVAPDGRLVYVTSESSNSVAVIDTATRQLVATIPVGTRPRSVVFSPDGRRAYVANEIDATISVIDTATRQSIDTIMLPGTNARPMGLAVAPNGSKLYVTTGRGTQLIAIALPSHDVLGAVEVGLRPWGVALSPDGRFAYTANGPSNDVTVVATDGLRVVGHIPVGVGPWGIAVLPVVREPPTPFSGTSLAALEQPEELNRGRLQTRRKGDEHD